MRKNKIFHNILVLFSIKKPFTLRSIQTQHSVDWKVSIGGADGADDDVESNGAGGGADGTFSWGGALGCDPDTPLVCPYLAANCS